LVRLAQYNSGKGWYFEPYKHSLAARGIKTSLFSKKCVRYAFVEKLGYWELNDKINKLKSVVIHTENNKFDVALAEIKGILVGVTDPDQLKRLNDRLEFYENWREAALSGNKELQTRLRRVGEKFSVGSAEYLASGKEEELKKLKQKIADEDSQKIVVQSEEALKKLMADSAAQSAKAQEKLKKEEGERLIKHKERMKKLGIETEQKTPEQVKAEEETAKELKYGF
jgi:hypothetical protein